MIEIIKHIAAIDFPERWGNFLENIIAKIRDSNDFQEVYGSLLALYAIFANYEKGEPFLSELVDATFGFLEIFVKKLLDDYGVAAASALHIILKIFSSASAVSQFILTKKLTVHK